LVDAFAGGEPAAAQAVDAGGLEAAQLLARGVAAPEHAQAEAVE
jgi:hypothetical protein